MMKSLISLLLILSMISSPLALAKPYDAPVVVKEFVKGSRVYAVEDFHQTLDEKTIFDLELRSVLIPYLAAYAPTALGQMRIQWLLTHMSLDAKAIQDRQMAVQEIAGNEQVFQSLKIVFEGLKQVFERHGYKVDLSPNRNVALSSIFHDNMTKPSFGQEGSRDTMVALIGSMTIMTLAAGILTGSIEILAQGAMFPAMLGMSSNRYVRNMIVQLQNVMKAAGVIREGFKSSPSGLLRELSSQCNNQLGCVARSKNVSWLLPQNQFPSNTILDMFGLGGIFRKIVRGSMSSEREGFSKLMGALAELESLYAAAAFYRQFKEHLNFPTISEADRPYLMARQIHHPFLLFKQGSSIANNVNFDGTQEGFKTAILTGPNAGGKTTYLRNLALARVQSAAGFPLAVEPDARISTFRVYTNFTNVGDSTENGASTFRAQSRRVGDMFKILREPTPVMLFMDEILTGTSNEEHRAAERATFEKIHAMPNTLMALATHDRSITVLEQQLANIINLHVDEKGFLIHEGPATKYNAFDVMDEEGVPKDVTDRARQIFSCEMAARG